jgi:hypothetical protein
MWKSDALSVYPDFPNSIPFWEILFGSGYQMLEEATSRRIPAVWQTAGNPPIR